MSYFGAILVAIGLLVAGFGFVLKARALRQRTWRRVPGTIVRAEVRLVRENFAPVVEYSYSVDGRSFRGTRVYSLSATSSLRGSAERVISQYKIGNQVQVFVDPEYATEAVLRPGGDPMFLPLMLAFALLPLVVGLAMLQLA